MTAPDDPHVRAMLLRQLVMLVYVTAREDADARRRERRAAS